MYLSTFLPRMTIVHREGRAHQNANGLSRLPTTKLEKEVGAGSYYMKSFYHISLSTTVISDQEDFLKKIAEDVAKDWYFAKIMKKLRDQIQKTMNRNEESNVK